MTERAESAPSDDATRASADRARWGLSALAGAAALAVYAPGIARFAEPVGDEGHYLTDAYRLLHGGGLFNTEHPPLGKVAMAGAMLVAGDGPIGWRLVSLLSMVLLVGMLPLLVVAAGVVRADAPRWVALIPSAALLTDPLVSTSARVALLDAFLSLLYTASALAWLVSLRRGPGVAGDRARVVAGALAGLALATKWTAVTLWPAFAVSWLAEKGTGLHVRWRHVAQNVVPAAVTYVAAFAVPGAMVFDPHAFPAIDGPLDPDLSFPARFVTVQWRMLTFHTSYFGSGWHSPWYEWLIGRQPIWYAAQSEGDALRVLAGIGSPVLWPLGVLAMLACLARGGRQRSPVPLALAAFPSLQLVLWAVAPHSTVLYYALPLLPFFAMSMAHVLSDAVTGRPDRARGAGVATVVVLVAAGAWAAYVDPLVRGSALTEPALRAFCEGPSGMFACHEDYPVDTVVDLARRDEFGAARVLR
ncbi:MAG: phospholipid carrier-dependent glycosyltransferase [Sandaracinaceae bacterium]